MQKSLIKLIVSVNSNLKIIMDKFKAITTFRDENLSSITDHRLFVLDDQKHRNIRALNKSKIINV